MKQLGLLPQACSAIRGLFLAFAIGAPVLALLLAAPPAAIGQEATGSAPQAGTSGIQTGAVPAAGTSEGASAQAAESSSSPSSTEARLAEVSFQDGLLSVSAEGADLVGLLGKVAKAAGVPIEIQEGVSGSVTIFFARLALEEGITRILDAAGSRNVLATFEAPASGSGGAGKLTKISVLRQASGAAAPRDPRRFGFETNVEALKRHIEARYGKGALWEESITRRPPFGTIGWFAFYDRGVSSRVTENNAQQYAEGKIGEFATFLSLAPEQVRWWNVHRGPLELKAYFGQVVASVPVEGALGSVSIIHKDQDDQRRDLVYVTQGFHPSISISTTPTLTPEEAAQRGEKAHRKAFPVWNTTLSHKRYEDAEDYEKIPLDPPKLVILPEGIPERDPARYEYYLAYKIGYSAQTYYIDAHTGKVIHTVSRMERSTATIRGLQYPSAAGPPAPQPLRSLNVMRNGVLEHTDSSGNYTYNTGDTVSVMLKSTYPSDRQFVILDGSGAEWPAHTQAGDFTFVALPGETTDAAHGYRPNVYYWTDRAFSDFQALGTLINRLDVDPYTLGQVEIKTDQNMTDLGESGDNRLVKFRQDLADTPASSLFPDVILHELSHCAVYAHRGAHIGTGDAHKAISEGLADYFACRMAGDSVFFQGENNTRTYDLDTILGGGERKPVDINGDSIVTPEEWEYYENGMVVASILWDLTKSTAPGHTTDDKVWESIPVEVLPNSSPEALYGGLRARLVNPAVLWDTFSAHGMNLVVRPASTGGISLDWFQHYGSGFSGYKIYRNETGSFTESDLLVQVNGIATTSWIDVGPFQNPSHRYHYAVRAVGGGSPSVLSNSASANPEPPGGDPPGPPSNFTGAEMLQGSTPYVQLGWDASTGGNLSEYLIERSIFADFRAAPETVNLHVPATQLSKADYGPLEGFAVDTPYYYRIRAVDRAGLSSPWLLMNPTSVIPQPNPPAKPTDFNGRAGNGNAKFTWTAPSEDTNGNSPLSLAGYRLYYNTGCVNPRVGPYDSVGSESRERTLANDASYCACVTALDTLGNESECSDMISVSPIEAIWVHQTDGPLGSYTKIGDALAAADADAGKTIMVGPGTYHETSLIFAGPPPSDPQGPDRQRDVTLQSERGPAVTIIDRSSGPDVGS